MEVLVGRVDKRSITLSTELATAVEELQALVQEGIDSGPGQFAFMEEIKAEARRRYAASQR